MEVKMWAFDKSISNMLDYYREDLLGLIKDKKIVDAIPLGMRKRFVEYGILRKFGTRFELTMRGSELLQFSGIK